MELLKRIENKQARLGVIGLGYVGLPLAIEFARAGFHVVGYDVDKAKVAELNAGSSYIPDVPPRTSRRPSRRARSARRLDGAELADVDIIDICVPTPLRKTRDPRSLLRGEGRRDDGDRAAQGAARHPRVHDLPGHDRRSRAAGARGQRAEGGGGFLSRVLARARRSGQPDAQHEEHSQGRRRQSTRRARGRGRLLQPGDRHGRPGHAPPASPRW